MNSLKQTIKASIIRIIAKNIGIFAKFSHLLSPRIQSLIYDSQTLAVMKRLLNTNSNCIDIGAHQGSILQEIIAIAPEGQHFAFEPIPHLAQALQTNFPDVHIQPYALSNHGGTSAFQYVVNDPAYSGLLQRTYDRPDPQIEEIQVEIVRLDDIIPPNCQIDFIKLDIEGGEFHALQGAIKTIRRCRPVIIFEAGLKSSHAYGVKPEELYSLIVEKIGYKVSTMANWLQGKLPYQIDGFTENWYQENGDYYFIAYPEMN